MRFTVAILITFIVCKCKTSELTHENEQLQDNETVQTDDNCRPSLSNLKFNASSEELNVTWDASEKCNFQYNIIVTEVSQTVDNILSKKINTTHYLFRDIKPCTKYKVTVELFQNGDSNVLANLTENFEIDSIAFNQIEKLNISTTTSDIRLSWMAHKYAHICNIRYIITANKEIPYFRYVNRTEHWIKHLHSCTEYNVSVTPSSVLRSEFDDKTPHFMHPISTLPEKVNNLTLNVQKNISTITWIPPDNSKCIKEYKITIKGTPSKTTPNTSLESSESLYCTVIEIAPVSNNNKFGEAIRLLKPGPVQNLNTESTATTITASWELPENGDCVESYSVELVGAAPINTQLQTHTFDNLKSCLEYEIRVAARSTDGTLGEYTPNYIWTSEPTKPGPVQNLATEVTETSITASWELPENSGCVENYSVELVGTEPINTQSLTHTFDNLKSCLEYEIKVAAVSSIGALGDYSSSSTSTDEPKQIGPVEKLVVNNSSKLVTWEHPQNTEACNITYVLRLSDNNDNTKYEDSTTETSVEIGFNSWIGCMDYSLTITPTLHSSEGEKTEERLTVSIVTTPPTCREKDVYQTSADLECDLEKYETNMCAIQTILIICEASEDENDGNWIIWNATGNQDIEDDFNRHPVNVLVEKISEFTIYTCYGIVTNSAGNSPKSDLIKFQTKEGVPDAPRLTEITPTNKTVFIKWTTPEKIPGILQNYSVTIKSLGAQYPIPDDGCVPMGNTSYEYAAEPSVNEYTFPDAFPSYKYEVSVNASTRAGYGPPSAAETRQTKPGIPDEPRNINFTINNSKTSMNYDATVTLTWMYPCYTNGKMQHFEVDVLGIPYADLGKDNDIRTDAVFVNEIITELNYEYTIVGLKPAFNYSVYINTVSEEMLKSNQQPLDFRSPESYPEAPVFKPITEVEKNAFTLEWDEPPQKNGYILSYNIIVTDKGPSYWVPPDCSKKSENYNFTVSNEVNNYIFKNAAPYHKYDVSIGASTSIGKGSTSENSIQTLSTEPKPVRELSANQTNSTTEEYNAQLLLSFKYPCNIYGSFKQVTVTLHGSRSNNMPHNESRNDMTEKEAYKFEFSLHAEYEYVLMVQVETEGYNTTTIRTFTSSSGVPPNVTKSIQAPVPRESTQATFTLDRNLFDEQYGTILYYALILGENNYEEKSRSGFWNGTDDAWPPIINATAEEIRIQPYQATPILWNPFNVCNCSNYTFILGDVSLSEFNKPLQDGIVYTLKVRGFTQFGFRDSPTITFSIPAATNLALILGLVFGLLGPTILLGIFILWRKRRQWQKKKDSIKSIPLTPIPVAIQQFSQYYNELRNNGDRLKQEFTFLTNKSNELILPSQDGVLPENKKKNRYTNIIPYDETRVKLMDTNDNYAATDYINASYIIGYSGTMEYIATQGPLEDTCMEFWKMVIQENSSLIVMVAQFVEQNKDKCYKYFPNNHENMELENGIAIRCCTELDFKTHIVRTLLIQKDLQQWTVTHLQFTDWPDFGCPTGTEIILEFCQIMREHAERNADPIIIHCSAGVGRTGTLIALDIVLQAISYKRDIDIFGTVLNLRRDRKSMVQTKEQYLYIHNCIKDAIENPPPTTQCDISKEPVYENLEEIKRSQSDDNIKESIF